MRSADVAWAVDLVRRQDHRGLLVSGQDAQSNSRKVRSAKRLGASIIQKHKMLNCVQSYIRFSEMLVKFH